MDVFWTLGVRRLPPMNASLPNVPVRRCSSWNCTPGNTCLTTLGECFWLAGSPLCGGSMFPLIRLHGPLAGDATIDAPEDC